jgi:hypothetical protein
MSYNITRLEPGNKILLFKIEQQRKAYKDQYNVFQTAWVVLEEVEVTLTETKEVSGDYEPKNKYTGFKAVSETGEEFFQNWDYFPMDSPAPYKCWYKKSDHSCEEYVNSILEVGKFFFEHTSSLQKENATLEPGECKMPLIRKNGEFVPAEYEYCRDHYAAFHKGEECSWCVTPH